MWLSIAPRSSVWGTVFKFIEGAARASNRIVALANQNTDVS